MKNSNGKGIIRMGDATTHGGKVLSGANDFKVLGRPIACEGDLTVCPKCKGVYPVQVNGSDRRHLGRFVAYQGDQAACGAKLLSSI